MFDFEVMCKAENYIRRNGSCAPLQSCRQTSVRTEQGKSGFYGRGCAERMEYL